jgi:hypothetical protein
MPAPGRGVTARLSASPWGLAMQALGGPRSAFSKLGRLAKALRRYGHGKALDERLERLKTRGIIERIPTRAQIVVGGIDMLRFWISPASAEYYEQKGIDFAFHQLLRFLEEPASLSDPVGFFSTKDGIIGHLMQVVHANPVYDLELLQMFDDGLDRLEEEIGQMLQGTHPRAASIGSIVEEPDYHVRLLEFVRAYRADPTVRPLLRSNVAQNPVFSRLDRTFGSLRTAMRYFIRLPPDPIGGAMHLVRVNEFPWHLAEL